MIMNKYTLTLFILLFSSFISNSQEKIEAKSNISELSETKEKKFSTICRPPSTENGKSIHIWHIAFCQSQKPTLRKSQRVKFSICPDIIYYLTYPIYNK
ncbi:MAG: hypothetical protein A2X13_11285 [Bacteroidetes bacterium GWC2_33_15]|nr:MAG: hypothetical protein A2X10_13475 [Bacteroidetes bacterium GWA2_33_15]OFX49249.1 MAG: hypothetical protein A2X13_11285 [Bacteroidetes bacterium GWC2_33_15]OFX65409.1 MAG: hypothetical protein A2X15_00330 [Bacteroidetes bacterium GWB2_32_14]OFX69593.1 MAG: hypothetical protein A2X14_00940 [Bacteroidetes bacterium GWD2_33_33]HAN17495.1 hypothetical protein [Bacteroidales bacterium]